MTDPTLSERIAALEARDAQTVAALAARDDEISALRAEMARLRAETQPATVANPALRGGRRQVLKLAGAAAVGVAAGLAGTEPAAASNGDAFLVGKRNLANVRTELRPGSGAATDPTGTLTPETVLLVGAQSSTLAGITAQSGDTGIVSYGAVNGVVATSELVGVYGEAQLWGVQGRGGNGVVGQGTTGYAFLADRSAKASVRFGTIDFAGASKTPPPSRVDSHSQGELDMDLNGDLWFCITGGSPGIWRKVSGPQAAGAFHVLTAGRVYDSRLPLPSQGAIASGQSRTISVADQRSTSTGAVVLANLVPAGATAVAANVTIVSQAGAGFLALNPGGELSVSASIVNWSAAGQILSNGAPLKLNNNRELTIVGGGGGSTHVIVDILGYFR